MRVVLEASDDRVASLLRQSFAAIVVEDVQRAANYSLSVSHDPAVFHVLYRNGCVVVASPSLHRVVTALRRRLAQHGSTDDVPTVQIQALALFRRGRAFLVPTWFAEEVRRASRRLATAGYVCLDSDTVDLDLDAGEIVVSPGVDADDLAWTELLRSAPEARRADPMAAPGRYVLDTWMMVELWSAPGAYSRPTATRRASLLLRRGPSAAGPDTFVRLGALFERVHARGIDPAETSVVQELLGLP